ncbi:HEAT repeat domain-containing protein [Synechococcus sp. HIMB2401]|uniref:HEAT repeat domain-containing protein n=1 Tax=Synechococcus sp. HIMB2401 TaxID=3144208 RepID=UPI0036F42AC3
MQNVLLPGAVVLLTLVLWLRRKPVKPMLSSTDASRVAQINRAQLELVIEPAADGESIDVSLESWTAPSSLLERLALGRRLKADMEAGPEQRLRAVRLAARWGHRSALPLLRQALRDSDARVVEAAAAAIEPFRGAPAAAPTRQPTRPPRNVSRMR